jgi:hypothetical protein
MTARKDYYATKAALLDPACQVYQCGQFTYVTPAPFYMFNGWYYRFAVDPTNPYTGQPNFSRNLGVDRYTLVPAGTTIIGTNESSFIFGAVPSPLVASDTRYADGEDFYFSRIQQLPALEFFQIGDYRAPGTETPCGALFPADNGRGIALTAITSHGGSWTTVNGGAVPRSNPSVDYILNTTIEINDVHEQRFTSGMEGLQPLLRTWFNGIQLGLGTNSDVTGPNPAATWCGAQGVILPANW